MLAYQGELPTSFFAGTSIELDGESLLLPSEYTGESNLMTRSIKHASIPTPEGILTFQGDYVAMVVDGRKHGASKFYVRFFYSQHKGKIQNSTFQSNVSFDHHGFKTLGLEAVANRTFADPVAADGKGGWTDQGPNNDLSAFSSKSTIAGSIDFDILSSGNTALVLSKHTDRSDKRFAELAVPESLGSPKYLYLLHASAYTWGNVGNILVKYHDGSEQVIEVKANRNIGNWWNPVDHTNAAVVWNNDKGEANVGLYQSRFELKGKPIDTIAFKAVNDPIWMLVGATFSDAAVPLPKPEFHVIRENQDWVALDTPMTITPGSALDFSNWTDAPAGKYGHVITTPDGHFAFENDPQQSVRFFGTNINFSANFLSKAEADALALRLRQMGYNALRIHHYDVLLAGGWNPDSYIIDSDQMDRLNYLFYALKKNGIYISNDLFTIRRIRNSQLPASIANNAGAFKALIPISEDAMDEWKRFARDLLTHKNPYTGMTWAEDPALFSICPVNEDTIWASINADRNVKALYQEGFQTWFEDNPRPAGSEALLNAVTNEYLAGVQIKADAEMRRFLREDLGCEALLTGNNWKAYYAQTPVRSQYDYVDNHAYWDHPSFPQGPWKFPFSHSQRSATQDLANVPRRLFLTRIENIPFTITEYNYVYPNRYRSEGGPLIGAYAALQDYDGLFRFSWAHERNIATSNQPSMGFDIAQDPIGLLTEHIIGMLWLRGDVPVLEEEAVYVVNRDQAFAGGKEAKPKPSSEDMVYKIDKLDQSKFGRKPPEIDLNHTLLGLSKRVSSRYDASAQDLANNMQFEQQRPQTRYEVQQDNTSVIIEKDGDFLVETPKSKAVVIQNQSLDKNFVSNVTGGPTTVFVGSLDDKPLETSKRLLVLHLTNILTEGMKFGEEGMYQIIDKGSAQKLVKRGSATIRIPNDSSDVTVYAIDLSGNRIGKVPASNDNGRFLVFQANTVDTNRKPNLAYEVIR